MVKGNITASVELEVIEHFDTLGINRSQFIEECMREACAGKKVVSVEGARLDHCEKCGNPLNRNNTIPYGRIKLCRGCYLTSGGEELKELYDRSDIKQPEKGGD